MHICITGPKTCPPEIGGVEVFAFEMGKRLCQRGLRVSIICHKDTNQQAVEMVDGIEVHRVRSLRERHLLKLSMMPGILKEVKNLNPSILHANDATSAFLAGIKSRRMKTLVTVHGLGFSALDWPFPFRQGIRYFQLAGISRAQEIVASDESTARELRHYRKDISIIPAGVDTDMFKKRGFPPPAVLTSDRTNIIFVGRLSKVKGIDILMEGLSALDDQLRSTIRLVVIGDGPMADLVRTGAKAPLEVKWLGEMPHRDIAPYFANADLFVLPSRSEGLPISLLEAMSSEVPAICTMVGGIGSEFDHRFLTPVKEPSATGLAEAIKEVLENPRAARLKAEAAREIVVRDFSLDAITEKYLTTYRRLEENGTSAQRDR